MAAQKGLEFLLKIGDGLSPEGFTTIGGGQEISVTRNNASVPITSQDETDRDQELLPGAGVNNYTVNLSGVFKDETGINALEAASRAATYSNFQIVVPGYSTHTGPFHIETFEFSGAHDGEVQFSASLNSAQTIAFVAT